MKKRQNFLFGLLVLVGVFLVFTSSCEKDDGSSLGNSTNGKTTAVFNPAVNYGTMTDQDGNVYKTVTIGTQTWMAENLRTTKYNDGTSIPNVTDDDEWTGLSTGAYCNYNNTSKTDTIATYGRFYNWHAVNTGKLAPSGWHVPSDAEWTTLTNHLSNGSAGVKMREAGTTHWKYPLTGVTNETGFTALPGGYRNVTFGDIGWCGYWWSATEITATSVYFRCMYIGYSSIIQSNHSKEVGFSVRCVRD